MVFLACVHVALFYQLPVIHWLRSVQCIRNAVVPITALLLALLGLAYLTSFKWIYRINQTVFGRRRQAVGGDLDKGQERRYRRLRVCGQTAPWTAVAIYLL